MRSHRAPARLCASYLRYPVLVSYTHLIESYAAQLRLYRRAFALRLPVPVTKLTIYSFAMQDELKHLTEVIWL